MLSQNGIEIGSKVNDVLLMPPPHDVSSLRSFLGSVQFYGKFLPPHASSVAELLHRLTRKGAPWRWECEDHPFQRLKTLLSSDKVLVHFDPTLPVGISCDASNVGIGAVLFHCFPDGSERPIANASKSLTRSQRNYSQVQKEAMAIVYALKKFYQYLFGRRFLIVTDHKPLLALFGPEKAMTSLAANRLARWALFLNQFSYQIVHRKTVEHQNADVLSRLPAGVDTVIDAEEDADDVDTVCMVKSLRVQVRPSDPASLETETAKDPVLTKVMRFTREGWPGNDNTNVDDPAEKFRKIAVPLSNYHGRLLYKLRAVIPAKLQSSVLSLLHQGHFGVQKMKQLARTAVYWPNIDHDIADLCRKCTTCAIHQTAPPKAALHLWMLPEKPWSRLHLHHVINIMGHNLVGDGRRVLKIPMGINLLTTQNKIGQSCTLFSKPRVCQSLSKMANPRTLLFHSLVSSGYNRRCVSRRD